MAVNYELLNKGGISLSTNFDAIIDKPLDARQVVPAVTGIQNLIDNGGAYAGMITYVTSEKRLYEVYLDESDNTLKYKTLVYNEDELKALIGQQTTAAMEFKGATATLPENPTKGDMYKVAGENIDITIDNVAAKIGDSIVYDGTTWYLIPSGDDIEDTWRAITGVDNDATLTFVSGDKINASVTSDGNVTFNHDKLTAAPADIATDEDRKTRTYITAVEVDEYGHVTNYKTATENVEDTNTEYEFTSQTETSSVYFTVADNKEGSDAQTVYVDAYSKNETDDELAKKVEKVDGYSLVSDTEIARLANVDNYNDSEVRGLIQNNADAIEDLAEYVGTIPNVPDEDGNNKYADLDVIEYINKKAQETLDAASGNSSEAAASVKQQLDDYIGLNNGKVAEIEGEIDVIDGDIADLKQAVIDINGDDADTSVNKKIAAAVAPLATTEELNKVKETAEAAQTAEQVSKTVLSSIESFATNVVAPTYATKQELNGVDGKFAQYRASSAQDEIDTAQDTRIKAIEDDYVVSADIANFATNDQVGEVADELDAYIESNDAALAAETKARTDADSALDKRIADLEANFGEGEGTVESQIAAAVAAEAAIARAAEQANAKAIEDLSGQVTQNLATKADKSVVEAMYTNDQIDSAISNAVQKEETRAKGIEEGLRSDVDTIKGDYLKSSDKTELQEQITANANAITTITNGVDPEKIDSLNDLINWADEHAPEVSSIKEDIEANAEAIAALEAKKAIIDVAELPAANIDTEATYRVLQGAFFTKNMERGDSYCYIVDEIPETGESVLVPTDFGFGFTGYYNRTNATLYGYFNQDTIDDLRDYVNNSDLNQIVKMSLLAIINGLSTGWMTMEQIVDKVGTALSLEWGGIVTDVNDVTNANALYFLLSSELFSYQNDAWVGSNTHRVGRPGFGVGSEIFNDPSNIATGTAAHAEGQLTKATGNASHAEGYNTTASGTTSHVEGDGSVASGAVAHAEGYKTKATGTYSHAEGCESQATGIAAHASGAHTKATGDYSFAAGRETTAAGENSVAMGWASTANGKGAVVLGTGLNDHGMTGAVVVGNFNMSAPDAAFIVGAGYAGNPSNALVVSKGGVVTTRKGLLATTSDVENAVSSHRVTAGAKKDSVIGLAATAEGANTIASGIVAHAEGDGTQAIADYTHAEGYQTTANGVGAHAEGGTTTAEGIFSHTEGQNTVTTAEATWGHAEGVNTIVAGMAAHAEGNGTIAASYAQHVQGQFNIEDENTVYAHIVGNGTDDENRSNAHTVDWNGNGWFKGEVLVGGTNQYDEEAKNLIHTVNASETSGLKVTKENGTVNIEVNEDIVWIFDCGSADI